MQDFTRPPTFNNNPFDPAVSNQAALSQASEVSFFQKVYLWMCGGLILTAVVAYYLSGSQAWHRLLQGSGFVVMIVVQLGLVFGLSFLMSRVSAAVIKAMFMLYAASVGGTMSIVLLVYPSDVIFKAFLSTAGVYGAMAVYGLVTKRSLEAMGSFLFMTLVGVLIASVINAFVGSPAVDFVICGFGVLLFAGLTAYDHQKLRVIHAGGFADQDAESKCIVRGALELYLDFINLFLFFVRLLGRR
jgi:FtsH-binding integral membrane protein